MSDIDPGPMPRDRLEAIVEQRERDRAGAAPPPQREPDRAAPPPASTPFARDLLAESATRILEAGELLILFEEASLAELLAAAGPIETRPASPVVIPPPGVALPASLTDILAPGAWFLSDRVRSLAGRQPSAGAWLRAAAAAAKGGLPIAADLVICHVETWPDRLEHLGRLREFHERTGGLRELGVRACRDPGELPAASTEMTALVPWPADLVAEDLARTVAIARLGLPRDVAVHAIASPGFTPR